MELRNPHACGAWTGEQGVHEPRAEWHEQAGGEPPGEDHRDFRLRHHGERVGGGPSSRKDGRHGGRDARAGTELLLSFLAALGLSGGEAQRRRG
eukprot:scaffold417_cov252-Pinguiococcus_pyrenoidosus.AAC.12